MMNKKSVFTSIMIVPQVAFSFSRVSRKRMEDVTAVTVEQADENAPRCIIIQSLMSSTITIFIMGLKKKKNTTKNNGRGFLLS